MDVAREGFSVPVIGPLYEKPTHYYRGSRLMFAAVHRPAHHDAHHVHRPSGRPR